MQVLLARKVGGGIDIGEQLIARALTLLQKWVVYVRSGIFLAEGDALRGTCDSVVSCLLVPGG